MVASVAGIGSHHVAHRQVGPADLPGDRRGDLGVAEVDLRHAHRRLAPPAHWPAPCVPAPGRRRARPACRCRTGAVRARGPARRGRSRAWHWRRARLACACVDLRLERCAFEPVEHLALLHVLPSRNRRSCRKPVTRARILTRSVASTRPTNSMVSVTGRRSATCTPTAGGPWGPNCGGGRKACRPAAAPRRRPGMRSVTFGVMVMVIPRCSMRASRRVTKTHARGA